MPYEAVIRRRTKPDVALRRFREMVPRKVTVSSSPRLPPGRDLNREMKSPAAYVAACVFPHRHVKKATDATTFGIHGTAYSIGFAGAGLSPPSLI